MTVVIGSAVVPTFIAQHWFLPRVAGAAARDMASTASADAVEAREVAGILDE